MRKRRGFEGVEGGRVGGFEQREFGAAGGAFGGDLSTEVGDVRPPDFSEVAENGFLAYAYLEAGIEFPRPYDQNERPLVFKDGDGKTTEVASFGITSDLHGKRNDPVRLQPRVLFRKGEVPSNDLEFAIDLCSTSAPSQVVVARLSAEPTLAAALARVEKETALFREQMKTNSEAWRSALQPLDALDELDGLAVPDMHWALTHHFKGLEGKRLANAKLRGQSIDVARQDIEFRLNRRGMELKSQADSASLGVPINYYFDRPFLIYLKKRGAAQPYFAMWVENAELLVRGGRSGL